MDREGAGLKIAIFVSTSPILVLNDRIALKSLDLPSELILSLLSASRTDSNQLRDSHNNGYNSPNTRLKPLSPRAKSLNDG